MLWVFHPFWLTMKQVSDWSKIQNNEARNKYNAKWSGIYLQKIILSSRYTNKYGNGIIINYRRNYRHLWRFTRKWCYLVSTLRFQYKMYITSFWEIHLYFFLQATLYFLLTSWSFRNVFWCTDPFERLSKKIEKKIKILIRKRHLLSYWFKHWNQIPSTVRQKQLPIGGNRIHGIPRHHDMFVVECLVF